MIVLRTPKGWTGPKEVDGKQVEGTFRAHQVPLAEMATKPEHMRHARRVDEELSAGGAVRRGRHAACRSWRSWRPRATRRMGANPHANGGLLLKDLRLPDFRDYAVDCAEARHGRRPKRRACMGGFLRDVMKLQRDTRNFRVFGPDETASNRLDALFEVTDRSLDGGRSCRSTITSAPDGRVMEDAERAHVPGLARGLSAHRPARLLLLLRGVHPHHRFDVQPAREVAEDRRARFRGAGPSRR